MTPTSQQIREARKALGLTQADTAKLLHMALRTYNDQERGIAKMSGAAWELMQIKSTTKRLLHLAWLELKTERDRCSTVGQSYDGLKINDVDLIDVVRDHLYKMP